MEWFAVSPRNLIHICLIIFTLFHSTDQNAREKRAASNDQPSIITQNGHLIFQTATNHNITFKPTSGGYINLDGENLQSIVSQVKDNKNKIDAIQAGSSSPLSTRVDGVERRLDTLTPQQTQLTTDLTDVKTRVTNLENQGSSTGGGTSGASLSDLDSRVSDLERQLARVKRKLSTNECASTPCLNGATCIDQYDSYMCHCTKNFQGTTCGSDVNECTTLTGTDLGCQNGATCHNTVGGFSCECVGDWHGVRCTQKHNNCDGATHESLCGNGICINNAAGPQQGVGYSCICDEGWTTDGRNVECLTDVQECQDDHPPCSVNPLVQCIELEGSFQCGQCPPGYTGNGFVCTDIDECVVNNGGCSLAPRVDCINTVGSRECGACPLGYLGDGIRCIYVGICNINRGGCHPQAVCTESPNFNGHTCTCGQGYDGDGIGAMGCVQVSTGGGGGSGGQDPCRRNRCRHGTCEPQASSSGGYTCVCDNGWTGSRCNDQINPCDSNPCQNGGSCTSNGNSGYSCQCTSSYTGFNCEDQEQSCGGHLSGLSGAVIYPSNGEPYPHGTSCAWVITTVPNKILVLTFNSFKLEAHESCSFDFLQIHDGSTASAQLIGKYCGDTLPNGGHINSTHNQIYMWFRSDASENGDGFRIIWNSADHVCGGSLRGQDHGVIQSPGYPGVYPNNADCDWSIRVSPGNKIRFVLGHLSIVPSVNCTDDRLVVRDGLRSTDPEIARFCSAADLAPVDTTGPYATLNFHTDASQNDRGFHIVYTSIALDPGCGGELTATSGILISPNYPNPYSHNAQCVWTISLPGSDVITLAFTNFSMETHRNCRYDFLEVRDGNDETSPFVGRYCGNTIPPTVVSSGNSLWVKFRADGSNSGTGFRASWIVECGGSFTEATGELTSPYFPDPYPNHRDCVYLIEQPEGTTIILTFATFQIEASSNPNCTYDYLEVRNGATAESPLLSRLCGSSLPAVITSPGNVLRLKFHSDGSIQNHGFRATYTTANTGVIGGGGGGGSSGSGGGTGGCGGTYSTQTGSFTSPNHPSVYPHGANCSWFITVPAGFVIRLSFASFHLEGHSVCRYDSVTVYEAFNQTGQIGRFCGSTNPGTVTSRGNTMLVRFRSDSSVAREGFAAEYVSMNATLICGGTFRSQTGVLMSPAYPDPYPASRDCEYQINVPRGKLVHLNVTDFSLEPSGDCSHDYLEIRNGGYDTSPLVGQYCGTTIDPIIVSHSNLMYLKLHTDYSTSDRGFSITYDGATTGCGGEMTTPSGTFVSPNYPEIYHRNAECFWIITASRGSKINLAITVDIEGPSQSCRYDYVEVRNDDSNGGLVDRLCGTAPLPHMITTTSNVAWVKFRSDYSAAGTGFLALYEIVCNNRLTDHAGVIESPGFPDPYPQDRDCSWVVEATLGNTIAASFSHFQIEGATSCQYDFVELRDGETETANLIGRYCDTFPPSVSTTGRYLYIRFRSDASVSENGFRLEYINVGCGGQFRGAEGNVHSLNYPAPYQHQRECQWTIETAPETRVELTLHDMDIEHHQQCQFDYLQAFGGLDDTAPELFKLCETNTTSQVFTSTGNQMMLKFVADSSMGGRGFNATYRSLSGGCGGTFTTASGTLMSQNYPGNYRHSTNCIWTITVATGRTVALTFEDFSIEHHQTCRYDYVAVYDGGNTQAPQLIKRCGGTLPDPPLLTSSSNQLTIRMRTDSSVNSRGFKASYVTGCGGTLDAEIDGEITSPGWPGDYLGQSNCSWLLQTQHPGDRLTLTFTHMELDGVRTNCSADYLRVLEGNDLEAPEVARLCGNYVPPPIMSYSSAMMVQFVSDSSIQKSGFRLVYTKSTSACGGEFTSDRGAFSSPMYPDNYPFQRECVWMFRTSPGNRLLISFRSFNLESSPYCNHDFLEVKEGGPSGQVLGRYCGNQIPNNVTAGTNLWVKFRSDSNVTAPGFMAVFNSMYGGELTGSSGQISSPQYPNNFPHNSDYTWTITADVGSQIVVTFLAMDTEWHPGQGCVYDFVKIRDGGSFNSDVIGLFCGTEIPATLRSSSNQLRVEFHSDYSVSGSGFLLEWQAVPPVPITPTAPTVTGPAVRCGGQLTATDEPQNFTSPNYPANYDNNLNCVWNIRSEPGSKVAVNFLSLHLEPHPMCRYDSVEIFGTGPLGTLGSHQRLARYCGRLNNTEILTSAGHLMGVALRTDSGVTQSGFFGQYRKVCGGLLTGRVGVIQSPNYPANYGNNASCTWHIAVEAERKIQITFNSLNLPTSQGGHCTDYVQLFNGQSADSPPLGSGYYCGSSIPEVPMTTSNHLFVKFSSDGSGSSQGFRLTYREYLQGCGGRLSLTDQVDSGYIQSPNYPSLYPTNVDCIWVITAPANERVQLDFDDNMRIENHPNCDYDYVEVRDGGTENAPPIGRFCGITRPSTQKSSGNVIFVRFRTDGSVPKTGFRLKYKIAQCGGVITGQSGVIQSPNYPNNYDNNLDCEWIIQGPTGHFISFVAEAFRLSSTTNCAADYLRIRDYNSTGEQLYNGCGYRFGRQSIDTSDNMAYVRFHSDGQRTSKGFRLRFNASIEECGGELTTSTGVIASPNYPGAYAHRRHCIWKIKVAQDRRVTLTFNDFNMEYHVHCRYDFLVIQNGALDHTYMNPYLGAFCGSTNPGTIESTTNGMTIHFVTDGSNSAGGFQATYTSDQPNVCGGLLTTADGAGTIESPGFAQRSYSNKTQCIWHLANHNAGNGSIVVDFTFLSLEAHGECLWDYVEIREGIDENGHFMGRYCGNETDNLPHVVSASASLWILYVADYLVSWEGFQLQYSFTDCGGTLTDLSGIVTSPSFPAAYSNIADCAWKIIATEGHQIKVHFTHLNIQTSSTTNCTTEYVEVFNGGLASSPSIGRFCGASIPADIMSMSSELRVQFHSETQSQSQSSTGFRLEYYALSDACGGHLHAQSGVVSSPNWPAHYPNNVECLWDINVQNGYHIVMNFTPPFELEIQEPCANDYVQINESGKELGKFCGNQFPPGLQTNENSAKVKFRTNSADAFNGFSLSYTAGCGATYAEAEGTIMSPGHPSNYGNDLLCNYSIIHDPQTFIELNFDPTRFGIEELDVALYTYLYPNATVPNTVNFRCRYDWLELYEGTGQDGRLLGRFCGGEDNAPPQIRARGSVFIQFKTDRSTTGIGWIATFNTSECGGTFTAESGSIQTPTHPDNYHHNANCSWLITVPENRVVKLKFNAFALEPSSSCEYDQAAVYDGDSLGAQTLGVYCGSVLPPTLLSSGRSLLVNFLSDSSVASGGFTAGWTSTFGPAQGCGGFLNATTGRLGSLDIDSDGHYEANLDCVWTILVPEDKVVRLTFGSFELESQTNCEDYDYVEVRDGFFPTSPLVGTYCGTNFPSSFRSSSNFLYVRFVSDDVNHRRGFTATYDSQPRLCGGSHIATEAFQNLTSPGYPANYAANIRCQWTIDAPEGATVEVKVMDMSIQGQGDCPSDRLQISNVLVSNVDNFETPHIFCGVNLPDAIVSYGRTLAIIFETDASGSDRGFSLQYRIASCNRTYSGTSGRLTSPGWPGVYPGNSNCEFILQAPEGNNLALFFNTFHLEYDRDCQYDYLAIRNGSDGSSPLLRQFCGTSIPEPLFVTTNVLWMKFKNDGSIHRPGYDITYIATPDVCGGNLSIPEGTFSSPGYPGAYPNDTECRWRVTVPNRRNIVFTFAAFDVAESPGCGEDYVALYSGDTEQAPLIGRYCGQAMNPGSRNITVTGTTAYVVFSSSQIAGLGSGFRLKFWNILV